MNLTDLTGTRLQAAVEALAAGEGLWFEQLGLYLPPDSDEVRCSVISSWQIENVTVQTARADRERARSSLALLLERSPRLRVILAGRRQCWMLIDDYGAGAVALGEFDGDDFRRQ